MEGGRISLRAKRGGIKSFENEKVVWVLKTTLGFLELACSKNKTELLFQQGFSKLLMIEIRGLPTSALLVSEANPSQNPIKGFGEARPNERSE